MRDTSLFAKLWKLRQLHCTRHLLVLFWVVGRVLPDRQVHRKEASARRYDFYLVRTTLWTFDNTLNDATGAFSGSGLNSPTYTAGIDGHGTALVLSGASSQCAIATPYLNMSYISFTWEFWIYPTVTPTGDSLFIGQCTQIGGVGQCLIFMTRNSVMWFAFWGDDIVGTTTISGNRWYHMAFVYDLASNRKFIYLDGVLEIAQNSIGPLRVGSTILTFGCLTTNNGASYNGYFTGYLDQMLYNSRFTNASEILDDATLVAYYRFLSSAPLVDSGPNSITCSSGGGAVSTSSGIVNQGMNFPVNGAYFQMTGLVLLGTSNRAFSLSVWFRISTFLTGGTIAHLSSSPAGTGWCIGFIGLSSNRSIVIDIVNGAQNIFMFGPVMPIASWTHVVYTFSTANGMILYVNGTLVGTLATGYTASGVPNTLTFGNPLAGTACGSGFPNQQFYGNIDEVKLYSRTLTASDVSQLYSNP